MLNKSEVFEIQFNDCSGAYIGQTKQNILGTNALKIDQKNQHWRNIQQAFNEKLLWKLFKLIKKLKIISIFLTPSNRSIMLSMKAFVMFVQF